MPSPAERSSYGETHRSRSAVEVFARLIKDSKGVPVLPAGEQALVGDQGPTPVTPALVDIWQRPDGNYTSFVKEEGDTEQTPGLVGVIRCVSPNRFNPNVRRIESFYIVQVKGSTDQSVLEKVLLHSDAIVHDASTSHRNGQRNQDWEADRYFVDKQRIGQEMEKGKYTDRPADLVSTFRLKQRLQRK